MRITPPVSATDSRPLGAGSVRIGQRVVSRDEEDHGKQLKIHDNGTKVTYILGLCPKLCQSVPQLSRDVLGRIVAGFRLPTVIAIEK